MHLVGLQNSTILASVQNLAAKSLEVILSCRPQGWKCLVPWKFEAYFGGGMYGADEDRRATTHLSDVCWRPKFDEHRKARIETYIRLSKKE